MNMMKTFLVGGAVRDQLLNYPVRERDWVVIGETPEVMLARGFLAVGKDFPVFLHPQTHDEYALARTERKTAHGYKGFAIHAAPDVTLEEDLIRRDLTINAMAMTTDGKVIDPYGGQADLKQKIFRHVSPAFKEDPVRVLRVARFAARYAHLGFTLAEETRELMLQMVAEGEVDHLVAERVWAELHKALTEQTPSAFFYTLKDCQALERIFPEIHALFGVPQPAQHHPEIDTGIHSLMCLEQAVKLSPKPQVRFAALLHDLGKALTSANILPHHYGHEKKGLPVLESFCQRLRVPNEFKALAAQVMEHHTHSHKAFELRPATLTDILLNLGAFKKGQTIEDFLLSCEADAKGRLGKEQDAYPQAEYIRKAVQTAQQIDTQPILASEKRGAQIGEAIRILRIKAIAQMITDDYSAVS
jgi:tRNA nucleotidyltransferase (CCA-adding enzyme)